MCNLLLSFSPYSTRTKMSRSMINIFVKFCYNPNNLLTINLNPNKPNEIMVGAEPSAKNCNRAVWQTMPSGKSSAVILTGSHLLSEKAERK